MDEEGGMETEKVSGSRLEKVSGSRLEKLEEVQREYCATEGCQ